MKGIQLSTVASNLSRYYVTKTHEIFLEGSYLHQFTSHIHSELLESNPGCKSKLYILGENEKEVFQYREYSSSSH